MILIIPAAFAFIYVGLWCIRTGSDMLGRSFVKMFRTKK